MFKKSVLATASAAIMTPALAASMFVLPSVANALPQMSCSVPNSVVCTVTSFKGLKEVEVFSNTPQGVIKVVDKSYRNCPTSVKVGWDSAYQMSSKKIVECGGINKLQLKKN